ncbi:hypothetical protein F4054_17875 [Candidatus Poribacteria bacterium]|nr:hypothetical protein [Candidatus Poribacteria bacterium]MYG06928.1 hypothetical protein [Candidatus Poribacteria bacterium]MYK24112.1 hypothetical protein [Candidatus Poribacteria bacterium]
MLKKINSKRSFTIALLLICGCVLTVTMLSKAIGANISLTIEGPTSNLWWDPGADWDNHHVYSGVYVSADRIGNNGEVIGTISVSGGRYPIFDEDEVLTDHEYVASACAGGAKGNANAWVEVPGKARKHDQGGIGADAVNWNNPNIPNSMSASDSCVRWEWGTGLRSMFASASHGAEGARIVLGFNASGI